MSVEPGPLRRLVTGEDAAGRSDVTWDGPGHQAATGMGGGRIHTDFWIWNQTPPLLDETDDAATRGYNFPGPADGGHLRIVQGRGRPADFSRDNDETAEALHAAVPEEDGRIWSRGGRDSFSSHMHKTQTIDYAVLLDGGRELELDEETVRFYPGDFVVDVGGWHRWQTPPEGSSMAFDMFSRRNSSMARTASCRVMIRRWSAMPRSPCRAASSRCVVWWSAISHLENRH